MIKFLLAALIFLNVSLANVEIADLEEGVDIDYDAQDDRILEQTENEDGNLVQKVSASDDDAKVIRQFIDKENRRKADRAKDKFNSRIPYEKWADTDNEEVYRRHKETLSTKLGWTVDYTKFWSQQAPNVGLMSAEKYAQYIVNRNGTFVGHNQTWVVLIGTTVDNKTQDVAREMNILARKFKRAKKTTYRWDFIDYIVDEQLSNSLSYRNAPSLYVIDGHDEMVYAWDLPFSEAIDNRTLGLWLKDRDYRLSKLSFEAPKLIASKMQFNQAKAAMWARKHIGWGFQNAMRNQPQFIKNLLAPVMDHDGKDPLRIKADNLIKFSAALVVLFVVFPTIYVFLKLFFWMCSYQVIIEIDDDAEWLELRKKGLID